MYRDAGYLDDRSYDLLFGGTHHECGCRRLRVELRRKIRDERKFDSLEELQRQIERDRSCILSSENRRR